MKSDENYCAVLLNNRIISSVWLDGRKSLGKSELVPGGRQVA